MRRTETPKPIWIKFCTVVDIPDVVTYTNFGDHWVAGGQISPSPIDFHRRPYNTLALPCERVITLPMSPTLIRTFVVLTHVAYHQREVDMIKEWVLRRSHSLVTPAR